MPKKLNQFDVGRVCPKCGNDDLGDKYCARCQAWACHLRPQHEKPVIHRHCRRCHYEWNELPLDAAEANHAEETAGK